MKRDMRIRRNLESHAKRMQELTASGMTVEAASKQALTDILKPVNIGSDERLVTKTDYRCSCTLCGWRGRRTLKAMDRVCPKCKAKKVFPDNPSVNLLRS